MTLYGIYEEVVGVPASSLSQLRAPWPENVADPLSKRFLEETIVLQKRAKGKET